MTSDERVRCRKCGMTFVVGPPLSKAAEAGRCTEPGCGRVHWASQPRKGGPVICGVYPEMEDDHVRDRS